MYPKRTEKVPQVLAAKSELIAGRIDLKSLETDLQSLMKTLENLEAEETKYVVGEVKLKVGITEDSDGKMHVGFVASALNFLRGEVSAEIGEKLSQDQLFEIVIRRK